MPASLLEEGNTREAYQVATPLAACRRRQLGTDEAEFYAGWIALRFLHRPEQAAKHFAEAANIAGTPISVARAAYWQGRALEAAGAAGDARRYHQRASRQADHLITVSSPAKSSACPSSCAVRTSSISRAAKPSRHCCRSRRSAFSTGSARPSSPSLFMPTSPGPFPTAPSSTRSDPRRRAGQPASDAHRGQDRGPARLSA